MAKFFTLDRYMKKEVTIFTWLNFNGFKMNLNVYNYIF